MRLVEEILKDVPATPEVKLTGRDFQSDQDVRWCPGCGDYSILAQVQRVMPELNLPRHRIAFISGIGCSSRFPYYMNTYGFHSIHGRATAIATGLKIARPDMMVWVATGDGDGLSIGGNHLIHACRRNIDIKILLFNNQIYGLTKGQYSPTSEFGKVTKSTPHGSVDHPFNPLLVALGAEASFVARTLDRDPKHLQYVIKRAAEHRGTSFVEVYQNCNVFNDGAFFTFTEKDTRDDNVLAVEHGKPMIFGKAKDRGIRLDGFTPTVVSLADGKYSASDLMVHNEKDTMLSFILARMSNLPNLPRPTGVIYSVERPLYEVEVARQIETAVQKQGEGDLAELLDSGDTWTIN
ncbi:MAG TPA: 2-oxoacid:ferredoxin oxidoreductase subunit beta [Bacteroidota bacterium]|nr:2-oxoacid:ferredoxin oxidoreductase subunit beta [Bacteroidota bacterium]